MVHNNKPRFSQGGVRGARMVFALGLTAMLAFGSLHLFARGAAEEAPEDGRLRVVATHSIIGDFVRNVAGDAVELTMLAGPNQDPHVYEPAPADSRILLEADLVFENGLLLKGWFDPLYRQSGSNATRVVVSDGVRLLDYEGEHGHDHGHGHDDHGHDHGHDSHDHASVGEIGEFRILDRGSGRAVVADIRDNHWHGAIPNVPVGDRVSLGAIIVSADGRDRDLSDPAVNDFIVALAPGATEDIVEFVDHGDHVHIRGIAEGSTEVVFSWTHRGELRYVTPPIAVRVDHDVHGHAHDDHDHGHDHDHDHDHVHGEYDPHVWQSVANAIVMVENIRDGLMDADPANAQLYEDNAAAYIAELEELDDYIFELATMIPHERRILVTGHLAYQYFADRYGFRQLGATLGAITTEGADPSAGEIAALIDEIRDTRAPAVFSETIVNPTLARRVADEAGVEFVAPIYSDALDEPGTEAGTYIDMMRHNIEIMVDALAR